MNAKKRSPVEAIKTPDQRIRKDAKAAFRYVVQALEGERLRAFLGRLHSLLTEWEPRSVDGNVNPSSTRGTGERT